MLYWDTSAIFKLYAPEPDSPYFLRLIADSEAPIISSAIVSVELMCALYRRHMADDLPRNVVESMRQFTSDVSDGLIVLVPYGRDIAAEAERVIATALRRRRPVFIRSLDVIHLCSALVTKADALVATDARLREMARAMGLRLLP